MVSGSDRLGASLNPLRTLDGCWHREVATAIESLMLEGRLQKGNALEVRLVETPTGSRLEFDIT
jgi:hypothetical protein